MILGWIFTQLPHFSTILERYGGGADVWSGGCRPCCINPSLILPWYDAKVLEIAGVTSIIDAGCIIGCHKIEFSATRVAQAEEMKIILRESTSMQVDGELWEPSSTVHIMYHGSCTCCKPLSKKATRRLKAE